MKQLIIFLLLIIIGIIGYGQFIKHKRYHSPSVDYKTDKKLDFEYHNQKLLMDYHTAIEDINSFVMLKWTANDIDVRTPEDDDTETKVAVKEYSKKLARIKYFEAKLEKSSTLKASGISNKEIAFLEKSGSNLKTYKNTLEINKIKSMFNANERMIYGQKSALIYQVQKQLVKSGLELQVDGIYKKETLNAIKKFEEKNNLFADGLLDVLTLDALFD